MAVITDRPANSLGDRMHVVVTCSNLKTRPIPPRLRLRDVPGTAVASRLRNWTRRLTEDTEPAVLARDLYAGQHWNVARRLPSVAPGRDITLWICSAGYGLIPASAPIRPYSATFARTHPDGVSVSRAGAAAWWTALGDWDGPTRGLRSLTQLAARYSTDRLLVVLSEPYLAVCRADLVAAVARLRSPSLLSVISAGTTPDPELATVLLPADARLQHVMGGTRQSLNVRVATHLLSQGHYDHAGMREHLEELQTTLPPVRRYDRRTLSDNQVRAFIRARLRIDSTAGHTRLLRELRISGGACEQARFATLFRAETEAAR